MNPPEEARPRVWWHWMNGNITKDGIRKDLEWMKRVGIGGFHHFDAALDTTSVVKERLVYMSPKWKEAFHYAVQLADSLGMDMAIASCPGWSNTGGPWVKPEQAMKKLVWTTHAVKGNRKVSLKLPHPDATTYPAKGGKPWYQDICVVAMKNAEKGTAMSLIAEENRESSHVVFPIPSSYPGGIKALSINDGFYRSIWAAQPAPVSKWLEGSDDGKTYRRICDIPHGSVSWQTINIPPTTATYFRIVYDKQPPRTPQIRLFTAARINHVEEKAGFATPSDMMDHPTMASLEDAVPLTDVVDLTDKMGPDGKLTWNAPEGDWLILRFGYTLTGKENHPAPREATGLEVSKIDKDAFTAFLEHYLNMYRDATADNIGKKGIRALLIDSYEAGWETWTPRMAEEFERRRGYPLLPWMPVLTGQIIGSAERSENFLFDWRTTIGELIDECMYENAADIAHKKGLETYFEAHENGRLYLVDGMAAKSHSDIPMAAMWTIITDKKLDNSSATMAESDIRESASVAHLYGKKFVAVESMTVNGQAGGAYSYYPGSLKPTADMELACGANRFVIHESSHQPVDDKRPGLGLGIYGQWFNRHETWAEQAKPWLDYLARSSYMMQQGRNVADILFYYGEDDVVTSLYGRQHPDIPFGYQFDYLNKKALLDLITFDGKHFVTPSGNQYKILIIGKGCRHFSPAVEQKLKILEEQGAPVFYEDRQLITQMTAQIQPDFRADDARNLRFVHRQTDDAEIYWVNNRENAPRTLNATFRVSGKKPMLWRAETGQIEDVSYDISADETHVVLPLLENDAVFVVFKGEAESPKVTLEKQKESLLCTINTPWTVAFDEEWGGPKEAVFPQLISYTESADNGIKYYSGTACYTNHVTIDRINPQQERFLLDLGAVGCIAEVTVNGKQVGTLWKTPYKIDVTDALRKGRNELEIRVTNQWANRIIGDQQPDCKKQYTYTPVKFYKADDALLPAGLMGPVRILVKETEYSQTNINHKSK